ncbi:MAG: epimerase [Filimonas sp.]|nr:epimerase [Filimonas sp.]
MKIKAIVTGATGMVGEGVLHECLNHPDVEAVLVINRRPCGMTHPKLKEIVHEDFFNMRNIAGDLEGYNACYFCLGMSSVGVAHEVYYRTTYTLTLYFAELLSRLNPDMTFCYVSGVGTDSTEKGKYHWARVKGKTENDLMKLPFKQVFAFRPGLMKPTKGLKRAHKLYAYLGWVFPIIKLFSKTSFVTLKEVGLAMINVTLHGYAEKIIYPKDIIALSKS